MGKSQFSIIRRKGSENEIYLNLVRRVLSVFSLLCQVDLHNETKKIKQKGSHKTFIILEHVCFVCCLIGLLPGLYYSYLYDLEFHQFKKLYHSNIEPIHNDNMLNFTFTKANHLHQVQLAWERARQYGKPYIRFTGVNQFGFLNTIIIALHNKVILTLYFRYWRPFRSDLIDTLMSEDEEESNKIASRITKTELAKLSHSSQNYISLSRGQQKDKDSKHHQVVHHIRPLLNKLVPFNRRRKWLATMCKTFCFTSFSLSICFGCFSLFLMFGITHLEIFKKYKLETEPMDLVVMLEFGLVNIISISCVTFYFSTTTLTSIDQIMSSRRISEKIRECIEVNESIFESATGASEEALLNRRVLSAFLDYRVFVNQTKLNLPHQGPVAFLVTLFIWINGPIVYLHAPIQEKDLLLLSTSITIAATICCISIIWLPFFVMQASCHRLYRRLYSLMAHIAHVQVDKDLYSRHLIDLLSKELNHPNKIISQLTLKQYGMKLTARRFLSYSFWLGLILIVANSSERNREGGNNGIILALI